MPDTVATTAAAVCFWQIDVMDYDDIGRDELIGSTVIDLEDRWFDTRWQVRRISGLVFRGVRVDNTDGIFSFCSYR